MTAPIIEIDGVSKCFGPIQVLREFSCEVWPGEKLALIGPSRSGKTAILCATLGELHHAIAAGASTSLES